MADALARHPEVRRVTLFGIDATVDEPCSGDRDPSWIISVSDGGHDASCVGGGERLPQCVGFAGHDRKHLRHVLCEQTTVPRSHRPPAWTTDLFEAAKKLGTGISVAPVGRTSGGVGSYS